MLFEFMVSKKTLKERKTIKAALYGYIIRWDKYTIVLNYYVHVSLIYIYLVLKRIPSYYYQGSYAV